jgi:hypothetical protein
LQPPPPKATETLGKETMTTRTVPYGGVAVHTTEKRQANEEPTPCVCNGGGWVTLGVVEWSEESGQEEVTEYTVACRRCREAK